MMSRMSMMSRVIAVVQRTVSVEVMSRMMAV